MEDLRLTDTAFEKYSRYGISLLTHMDIYFQVAFSEVNLYFYVDFFTS